MSTKKPSDDDRTTPFFRDDEPGSHVSLASQPKPHKPLNLELPRNRTLVGSSFSAAKAGDRMPAFAAWLIVGVIALHLGGLGASWASSVWGIERLDRAEGGGTDLALAPAPPPPPPPPLGGAKPKVEEIKPRLRKVADIVQPVKIEKIVNKPEDAGDPHGEVGGVEGGVAGGVVGGEIGGVIGSPTPPPPPPPAPPQNVPPTLLEGSRIRGDKNIVPNDVTKTEIQRSGKDKIVGSYKLCISIGGDVTTISQLKSTGFPAYDSKIQGEMRNWGYRPYMVNGKAVPVCTAVTFIYSQK